MQKFDKITAFSFLFIGLFLLLPLLGIWEPESYLLPGIIISIIGFAISFYYLGKSRLFMLSSGVGLFFSGIAMVVNASVIIRHYDFFLSFSFFFALTVIFFLLFWEDNFHKLYLIFSILTPLIGWMLLSILPSEFVYTLSISIQNTLVLSPFLLIFAGYLLLRNS
jgi:glucose-6-phosphate-specific signal transduction histidine kinase